MRFLSLLFIIIFFISLKAFSQSCLPQGIVFNTQTQIDSFQINYPGCTEIEGDVTIQGAGIINLNGLSPITVIGGDLDIRINPDLISLYGLSSLSKIGGSLSFTGNMGLKNLFGLDSLISLGNNLYFDSNGFTSFSGLGPIDTIPGSIRIMGNDSITDLNGLNHIKYIGGSVALVTNTELISLSGLDSLTYIGKELLISSNSSLTDLTGLNSLAYIGYNLSFWYNNTLKSITALNALKHTTQLLIYGNNSLKGLNGLNNLTTIEINIYILNNDSLNSISSLGSVTSSVSGKIRICENGQLTSLKGLDNLNPNSVTDLDIENNASLSTCHVQSICDYLAAPNGDVSIYGNAPGCSSREEVEARCAGGMETDIRVILQGAYSGNNSMNTNLNSVLPVAQPYDTLPWSYQGSEILNNAPSNMVDWVLVELRDSSDCNIVDDTRAGVLLEDGSIKDTNLINDLYFYNVDTGYYYMSVRHRNHISVMTAQPLFFPSQTLIDFTDTSIIKPYGGATQAQIELDPGTWGMICGDINNDGKLQFSGPGNDRMEIIQQITNVSGLTNITAVINGYYFEDLDLNTEVKYSGPKNDASIIIQNIITLTGSTSINSVYTCPFMFLYP